MNNFEKLGIASNQRFVCIRFLASYLGMNPSTIEQWVHDKKIPFYRIFTSLRFDIYEIEEWLKRCKGKEFTLESENNRGNLNNSKQ